MKTFHRYFCRALTLAAFFGIVLPVSVQARTAEDSYHFRNISSETPGEPLMQDQFPQLALSGNTIHLVWLAVSDDTLTQRLMYRRSTDGGLSFEASRTLMDASGLDLVSGLSMHNDETGQAPAYLAADGDQVHVVYLLSGPEQPQRIYYLRSTDGGVTFASPRQFAATTPNPPNPAPGLGHTADLGAPLVAAVGGRVVIAYRHTRATAIYTGVFGWQYGLYAELTVAVSADGGVTFTDSVLDGDLPTTLVACPSQLTVQGDEILLAARDQANFNSAVHAGISTNGGATMTFRRLRDMVGTSFGDAVRMVKSGSNVLVFFATEDAGDPPVGSLYVCRSADGGATYAAPVRLTDAPVQLANNSGFAIASHGNEIFVAITDVSISAAGSLLVRRSTDAGATFEPWSILADFADPRSNLLTPVMFPRFAVTPGVPGMARVGLLWSANVLATSADSAASFGPPVLIRPPVQVIRAEEHIAAQWLAGSDGVLHFAASARTGTSPDESDIFYRRIAPQPETGTSGQALAFDYAAPPPGDFTTPRHRDSLQIPAIPELAAGGAFTIEFWARFRGELDWCMPLASQSQGLRAGIVLDPSGNRRFSSSLTTGDGAFEVIGTRTPQPDTWYHFALRYDGSLAANQIALLIDGVVEAQGDAAGVFAGEEGPYGFGNYFANPAADFRGDIDDIRFWNTALPDATIRSRFQSGLTGNEEHLVAWYPLDGHTRDATGHQADGVLACRESFVAGVAILNRAPLPEGLVSWWRGEDNFLDHAQTNDAAGVVGVRFADGKVGRAFDLDGLNAHVLVESPLALPTGNAPRTLMLWCKTSRNLAVSTESAMIQYGSEANGKLCGIITSLNAPGRLYFFGYNQDVAGQTQLLPDTWYHVAFSYDGTAATFYLNGELDGTGNLTLDTVLNANGLTIGNRPGSSKWLGLLDEVMVFNRALSPTEIAAIHAADAAGCFTGEDPVDPPPVLPVPAGVIGWWQGEDDFRDRRGNNDAAGVGGAGFADGMVGRAFNLDGVNDFVQVAAPVGLPLGNTPRTLMLWCKTQRNLVLSTESGLLQYGTVAGGQAFGLITSANAPGRAYFYDAVANLAGVRPLFPDIWHHITVTYDGSVIRLFLDGQLEDRVARNLNTVLDGNGLTFGNRPGSSFWQGQLDEIMIFNRALEPSEVFAVHAAGANGCNGGIPPPVPPLTLVQADGELQLSWTSQAGLRYRIESSTTLAPASWKTEGTYDGTGGVLGTSFPIGPESRKFFRLIIQE